MHDSRALAVDGSRAEHRVRGREAELEAIMHKEREVAREEIKVRARRLGVSPECVL